MLNFLVLTEFRFVVMSCAADAQDTTTSGVVTTASPAPTLSSSDTLNAATTDTTIENLSRHLEDLYRSQLVSLVLVYIPVLPLCDLVITHALPTLAWMTKLPHGFDIDPFLGVLETPVIRFNPKHELCSLWIHAWPFYPLWNGTNLVILFQNMGCAGLHIGLHDRSDHVIFASIVLTQSCSGISTNADETQPKPTTMVQGMEENPFVPAVRHFDISSCISNLSRVEFLRHNNQIDIVLTVENIQHKYSLDTVPSDDTMLWPFVEFSMHRDVNALKHLSMALVNVPPRPID